MSKAAEFDAEVEAHDAARNLAGERLTQIVERIERIDEEIKNLRSDRTDIMSEAKAAGFDTLIIRLILKRRKVDRETLAEMDDLLDSYERAMGS